MATYKDALLRSVNVEKPVTDPSAIHQIEQTVPFLHALAIQKPKAEGYEEKYPNKGDHEELKEWDSDKEDGDGEGDEEGENEAEDELEDEEGDYDQDKVIRHYRRGRRFGTKKVIHLGKGGSYAVVPRVAYYGRRA